MRSVHFGYSVFGYAGAVGQILRRVCASVFAAVGVMLARFFKEFKVLCAVRPGSRVVGGVHISVVKIRKSVGYASPLRHILGKLFARYAQIVCDIQRRTHHKRHTVGGVLNVCVNNSVCICGAAVYGRMHLAENADNTALKAVNDVGIFADNIAKLFYMGDYHFKVGRLAAGLSVPVINKAQKAGCAVHAEVIQSLRKTRQSLL